MLGLPDAVRVCLFDLDGVLTKTATVHFAAWKRTFDGFLREHDPGQEPFSQLDYNRYVDGKHRADGVRETEHGSTLTARGPADLSRTTARRNVPGRTVHSRRAERPRRP